MAALGLVSQTFDQAAAQNAQLLVGGEVYFVGIPFRAGVTVTNLSLAITTPGVAVTMARVGLYSVSGTDATLLVSSANLTTAWESGGMKTHPLSAPYTIPALGLYYAAVIAVAGTPPTMMRGTSSSQLAGQIGTAPRRFGSLTGQADLPASATVGTTTPAALWLGAS